MRKAYGSLSLLALCAGCMLVAPLDEVNTEDAAGGGRSGSGGAESGGGNSGGGNSGGGNSGGSDSGGSDSGGSGAGESGGSSGTGGAPEESGDTDCLDWEDNDQDGSVDCNDISCCTSYCMYGLMCGGQEEMGLDYCFNGSDEDGDLAVDCDDLSCCFEPGCQESPACVSLEEIGVACENGLDDDGDYLMDCDDPSCCEYGCELSLACSAPGSETGDLCADLGDNDGDSLTDCNDPDCCTTWAECAYYPSCSVVPIEVCDDSYDNDDDLLVDCEDTDCCGAPDCPGCGLRESGDVLCGDDEDNDLDGYIDCDDASCCTSALCAGGPCSATPENDPVSCSNGYDDDGDGLFDCDDPECQALAEGCSVTRCEPVAVPYPPSNPLIDGFDDNPDLLIPTYDARNGGWYAISGGAALPPRVPTDLNDNNFLQQDLILEGDLLGVDLLTTGGAPCPYDASFYQGIRVAIGTSVETEIIIHLKTGPETDSRWEFVVPTLSPTVITVTWNDFTDIMGSGLPPDPSRIVGFEFSAATVPTILSLDELTFLPPVQTL